MWGAHQPPITAVDSVAAASEAASPSKCLWNINGGSSGCSKICKAKCAYTLCTAPGLAATYLPSDESAAASSFSRCFPPTSYARHFMARLDLRSCDAFRTDARVPGFVEAFRASMVRCAALHRSGGEEEWCDPRETGFDASALNAGFGTDASGDAQYPQSLTFRPT